MHAVEGAGLQHVVEHVDRVVRADADVRQLLLADALEQRAHAGLMHLAAEEIGLGQHGCDVRRGLAHAEADLQHRGAGAAAEGLGQVDRLGLVGHEVQRAQFGKGACLAVGGAATALDEALEAAVQRMRLACVVAVFGSGRIVAGREVVGHGVGKIHCGREL